MFFFNNKNNTKNKFAKGGQINDEKRYAVYENCEAFGDDYEPKYETNSYGLAVAYAKKRSKQNHKDMPIDFPKDEYTDYRLVTDIYDRELGIVVADFANGEPNYIEQTPKGINKKYIITSRDGSYKQVGRFWSEKTGATFSIFAVIKGKYPLANDEQLKELYWVFKADTSMINGKRILSQYLAENKEAIKGSTNHALRDLYKLHYMLPVDGIEQKGVDYIKIMANGGEVQQTEADGWFSDLSLNEQRAFAKKHLANYQYDELMGTTSQYSNSKRRNQFITKIWEAEGKPKRGLDELLKERKKIKVTTGVNGENEFWRVTHPSIDEIGVYPKRVFTEMQAEYDFAKKHFNEGIYLNRGNVPHVLKDLTPNEVKELYHSNKLTKYETEKAIKLGLLKFEKKEHGGEVENPHKHTYMMLSRLQQDCEYFLNWGNRNEKALWALNVNDHIAEMKKLWNMLPADGKPEWLTMQQIEEYENQMKNEPIIENENSNNNVEALAVKFKDLDNYYKAKKHFETNSAFYPLEHNEEFKSITFAVADQDDANSTEYYIDQEFQETDIANYYFESEGSELKMQQGGMVSINEKYMNTDTKKQFYITNIDNDGWITINTEKGGKSIFKQDVINTTDFKRYVDSGLFLKVN